MSNYQIVKEDVSLIRDSYSKAILNTNLAELENNRKRRRALKNIHAKTEKIDQLESDVEQLKSSLVQINGLLEKILQKL